MTHFWRFGGPKNGTSRARIKILRPLFNTNPPQNPHLDTLGTILDPRKVIFGHFIFFGHFPIQIPIETEKIQNSHFPGSKCSFLTYLFSGSKMQPGTAMCFLNFYTLVFWTPLIRTHTHASLGGSIFHSWTGITMHNGPAVN